MKKEPKYYWLKFLVRFFREDGPVDYMLSLPNGSEYVILYLKLWTLTINTKGYLITKYGTMEVPYDIAKIQRDSKFFSYDTVKSALDLYLRLGLIAQEEGFWHLECDDIQVGSTSASATRVARMRENQKKALQCNADVTTEIRDVEIRDIDFNSSIDKSIDDDIIILIDNFDKKVKIKTKKTKKLKNQIKNKLQAIGKDELSKYLDYIADKVQRGQFGDFFPNLTYITGSGFEEYYHKFKNKKSGFSDFKQNDYDFEKIEQDFLVN